VKTHIARVVRKLSFNEWVIRSYRMLSPKMANANFVVTK